MIANALPRPLTAGSVDNAILRADGTGGATLQNSGLVVEDTIVSFTTVTGDAGTDVITVTGSAFANEQPVRFTALTGGSGLNTTTNYFVREVSGATFKLETSIGGGAINFTTNITAGTLLTGHSVQVNVTLSENTTETNSALVLSPKGTGAFILGPKPDGTATGGNARGARAVDLQILRASNTQVATGVRSFIGAGQNNTVTADDGVVCGGIGNTANQQGFVGGGTGNAAGVNNAVCGGNNNNTGTANIASFIGGGTSNGATGMGSVSCGGGRNNVGGYLGNDATATISSILGGSSGLADRFGMQAHCSGSFSGTKSGDAQRARFVLRQATSSATPATLFLDGSSTRLTIPSNKVFGFTVNICGTKQGLGEQSMFVRKGYIKNVAGTTSLIGTIETIGTDIKTAGATTTDVALTADDTNDALQINVIGVTGENWRWVASVDAVEISY